MQERDSAQGLCLHRTTRRETVFPAYWREQKSQIFARDAPTQSAALSLNRSNRRLEQIALFGEFRFVAETGGRR